MVDLAATVKTVPQEPTANQVHLALQDNLANQENRAPLALQEQHPHRLKRL
jgi:hypothetical protein